MTGGLASRVRNRSGAGGIHLQACRTNSGSDSRRGWRSPCFPSCAHREEPCGAASGPYVLANEAWGGWRGDAVPNDVFAVSLDRRELQNKTAVECYDSFVGRLAASARIEAGLIQRNRTVHPCHQKINHAEGWLWDRCGPRVATAQARRLPRLRARPTVRLRRQRRRAS